MQQATHRIELWMGNDSNRYAQLTFHPGHGQPGFQVRLYEVMRSLGGDKITKNTVTEKSDIASASHAIHAAVDRWERGDFDPVTQGPLQGGTVSGDSGSHKV